MKKKTSENLRQLGNKLSSILGSARVLKISLYRALQLENRSKAVRALLQLRLAKNPQDL